MNITDQPTPPERVDFTLMYAAHDAFRRDLDRLTGAPSSDLADRPEVLLRSRALTPRRTERWQGTFRQRIHLPT
jgi:hypothetical protein